MRNVVVTGVNGFVGKHLVRDLHTNNIRIMGVGREDSAHSEIKYLLEDYFACDIAKEWPEVGDVDAIINLAGLAAVGPSYDSPQLYIDVNSAIVTNLCEYYLKQAKQPRIIVVSSGAIYDPKQDLPIRESSGFSYGSPYALSKVTNEAQVLYYRSRGLDCISARPFNHIGPNQLPGFLVPDLIDKLRNKPEYIEVGNLDTKRDYTDVRDVVRAYRLLATSTTLTSAAYNICSGASISGQEILHELENILGLQSVEVRIDDKKIRPNEIMDIYGDNQLLSSDTGWSPEIDIAQTLRDCISSLG